MGHGLYIVARARTPVAVCPSVVTPLLRAHVRLHNVRMRVYCGALCILLPSRGDALGLWPFREMICYRRDILVA